eukprot:8468317-Pyramimonas_sp.AAC.1
MWRAAAVSARAKRTSRGRTAESGPRASSGACSTSCGPLEPSSDVLSRRRCASSGLCPSRLGISS